MSSPLQNRRVILGVTGSIAAYKAADLASKLTQSGALVDVILTQYAARFVSPLTFQSVTGRKAYTEEDLWGGEGHVTHVGLAHNADLVIIAPASANTMAKLAAGIADNLLSLTVLAASCPILVSPAMDAGMYNHPATQNSVQILQERGVHFVGPTTGRMASGLVGLGRFVEPHEILQFARNLLARNGPLAGKKIIVTAGGTQEAIDPVRLITNRSSGLQGYAIASAALDAGAEVTLISAPTHLPVPVGCSLVPVKSAADMLEAVIHAVKDSDVLIMAAAVSDFRPAHTAEQKIKKTGDGLSILLEPTEDILMNVSLARQQNPFPRYVIGFAAESQDLLENAQSKLEKKNLDLIVANDITAKDSGFEVRTNRVTLLFAGGHKEELPLMEKDEVAQRIIHQVCLWLGNG